MTSTNGSVRARQVLRDEDLDRRLRTEGYVATPFLDADEVAALLEAYAQLAPTDDEGLVIDFMRPDRDIIGQVSDLLAPLWDRHLGDLFHDHRIAVATFVTKHPGEASEMLLHDEPSFVDERYARSHALWIPLVDVGPDLGNGHLLVLPGSDEVERGLAGFNTPVHYRPYADVLLERMVPVTATAGEAVVYDSRTLHASVANRTDRPRPAIAASVVPDGVPLVHVVATGRRHRRIHQVPDDFYVSFHPYQLDLLGMADPVVGEVDEAGTLDVDHLARLVGFEDASGLGEPAVLVPDDQRERVAAPPYDSPTFRLTRAETDPRRTDLVIDARRRTEERTEVGGIGWTDQAATVRDPEGPLLVVEPYGRAGLHLSASGDVEVLDCADVAAGLAAAGEAVQLAPGDRIAIVAGRDVVAWNNGPGQLVLRLPDATVTSAAATAVAEPTPARRSLLSRLRRRSGSGPVDRS